MTATGIEAVFWDFGGVITTSPFVAFRRYEAEHGLPTDFIRSVNATDPDDNAWARVERREIDSTEFDRAFAEESAALGHRIPGSDVLDMLDGDIRPEMVVALDRVIAAGLRTACLTNNVRSHVARPEVAAEPASFAPASGSSEVGIRKPEPEFYELACRTAAGAADRAVFLADLGVNLKPARAMGMSTIKVVEPAAALAELGHILGIDL